MDNILFEKIRSSLDNSFDEWIVTNSYIQHPITITLKHNQTNTEIIIFLEGNDRRGFVSGTTLKFTEPQAQTLVDIAHSHKINKENELLETCTEAVMKSWEDEKVETDSLSVFDPKDLCNGLYEIYWTQGEGGGMSLASVGQLNDGTRWMAPCNWVSDGLMQVSTDWSSVDRVYCIQK
jgi:hypothetical protein